MKRAFLVAALLFAASYVVPVCAADQAWLTGKWEMSFDPDGTEKDWLRFDADGKVTSISSSGNGPTGSYVVSGNQVQMTFTLQAQPVSITLTVSPDKKKLLNLSKRTGNTSEYTKNSS